MEELINYDHAWISFPLCKIICDENGTSHKKARNSGCAAYRCCSLREGRCRQVNKCRYAHYLMTVLSCCSTCLRAQQGLYCTRRYHGSAPSLSDHVHNAAVNLAVALARDLDLRVGLMDADVFGPSVPRMMNLAGEPRTDTSKAHEPA